MHPGPTTGGAAVAAFAEPGRDIAGDPRLGLPDTGRARGLPADPVERAGTSRC